MPNLEWLKKNLVLALMVVAGIATLLLLLSPPQVPHTISGTILVLALLAAAVAQFWMPEGAADGPLCDRYKACVAWLIALGGGGLVIFVLVWVVVTFSGANTNSAVGLSLFVLVGVIVLLIVISLVTFTYSVLGLANPGEALGLPDGSVRSIIALMLLVSFSIIS